MTLSPIPEFVALALAELEIDLTADQLTTLARYLHLLLEANEQINLTAIREPDLAWRRLMIDSLTALPGLVNLDPGEKVIDVGTGAGLPGIPMAIARPDLQFTLIDATGKKIKLINDWIATLNLPNVTAIQTRAEQLGQDLDHREKYHLAISRAVGPMNRVLEYMLPLVAVHGRALAMKGPRAEQELADAADALDKLGAGEVAIFDAYPDSFGNDLVIISIVKERRTPKKYPRAPGIAKQSPL